MTSTTTLLSTRRRATNTDNNHALVFSALQIEIVKYLGSGMEGTVYEARSSNHSLVVAKLFHDDIVREINEGGFAGRSSTPLGPSKHYLRLYADSVSQLSAGLYPIRLIEHSSKIIGLEYQYEPLFRIRSVCLWTRNSRRAVLAAFCRAQAYLLEHLNMAIADPQFMINKRGEFRFIDYGPMIIPINDFRCQEEHYLDRTFFQFLSKIYYPGDSTIDDVQFTSLDQISPYAQRRLLSSIQHRDPALRAVLSDLMTKPASVFFEPETYLLLAKDLPVQLPSYAVTVARCLSKFSSPLSRTSQEISNR